MTLPRLWMACVNAVLVGGLLLPFAGELHATELTLTLEIGDPARKGKQSHLVFDAITDTRTDELLSPAQLAERLSGKRIVLVGESHTDIDFHKAQLRIIQELYNAGREVLVGLEMYPYTKQKYLDDWIAGYFTEEGFLAASEWYDSWGYHWDYYRDIFLFAREHELPMYALNTPREIISAVRKKGFDELTEEEKAQLPPSIDTDNDEHFQLFKAFFADDESGMHASMTEEQWRGMFAAQCTWDASFGHNGLKALEQHPGDNAVLVVLVGSGHTTYDLGIQRQVANWSDVSISTVIPISIREWDEDEVIEKVQASYADFIWGMPPQTDSIYPSLGVSTRTDEDFGRRSVIHIGEDSVGERAGFQMGDLLLEFDGQELDDQATLRRLMAEKRWGDRATVKVQRGEETTILDIEFRRELPEIE